MRSDACSVIDVRGFARSHVAFGCAAAFRVSVLRLAAHEGASATGGFVAAANGNFVPLGATAL